MSATPRPDSWMPLYIGDYLADTMHLTREQHGGYLLLIMAYWRTGAPLRDDDGFLASIVKATPAEWRKLRPALSEFFEVGDGLWRHKRIDKELSDADEKYTRRKARSDTANAAKGANKDTDKVSDKVVLLDTSSRAGASQPQPQPQSPTEKEKDLCPSPDGADFNIWWMRYPRKVGKGKARKAYAAARKKADAATLLAGIDRYEILKPAYADWAHPQTWLNGERWLDEADAKPAGSQMDDPDHIRAVIEAALAEGED